MINLPYEFESRMSSLLANEFALYKASLNEGPKRAFRVNTEKISLEDFNKINPFSSEKIPYVETGFYLDDERVGTHPFHHAGMIYVQEPFAMAPAEAIEINPDWNVLDLCAAPGGKSSQIRNKLSENSVVVSNEIIFSRCKVLTGNFERLGFKNTVTTCLDTKRLCSLFQKTFDLIMVDAPCSGEGMFRKEEAAIGEWSIKNVEKCRERQLEILENAVGSLKNGGYIIYATCTFSLEENEMVIDSFLSKHPDFELIKPRQKIIDASSDGICFDGCSAKNINYTRRFYPHKQKGEGQFLAVLKNIGAATQSRKGQNIVKTKIPQIVYDFLNENLVEYRQDNVLLYNNNPVYFTPDFYVPEKTAFSVGVSIGEIRKNYILPHHQFFMAMGNSFKRKINLTLSDERLYKYLKGEEIEVDCQNGFAVVLLNGATLGGGKVSFGKLKNYYPKGLRNL